MTNNIVALPTQAEKPREMGRDERRIVFGKIDEFYINEKDGYQPPWTDAAIAKDLGVPVAWVSQVRDEMFGPAGSNAEIDTMLKDIGLLSSNATNISREVESLAQRVGSMFQSVKALQDKAAKIAQAVGR